MPTHLHSPGHDMLPRLATRARALALLLIACPVLAACEDSTGPGDAPPGRRLVGPGVVSDWRWSPSGDEIIFATRFDHPYTGPPTQLEAVSASTGARRTLVAVPADGSHILGVRLAVVGAHVYYEAWGPSSTASSFRRAPLAGGAVPQVLIDSLALRRVAASPDERTLAWIEGSSPAPGRMLVTLDVATGARRSHALSSDFPSDRVWWSPTGRSIVVDPEGTWTSAGTPFQLVDLASGTLRPFVVPTSVQALEASRDIGWEGETPILHSVGPTAIVRRNLVTGASATLAPVAPGTVALGWSPDFETVFLATHTCRDRPGGAFLGECHAWSSEVDRLAWRTGARTPILRYAGESPIVFARPSPDGQWLAYHYNGCGPGCPARDDGLYVVAVR